MHPYSNAWGRGGPLDQTPTPGPTRYQDYVDQYQALNDAWYDSWLNPVTPPIAVPDTQPEPLPPASTPYTDPAPAPTASSEGYGGGLDYGRGPSNPNSMSLGGMFSGPTTELFGDTQYSDIEPGALSMMGMSSGTGVVGTGPYAEIRDVVAFDPVSLGTGLIGSALAGPIGGTLAGYIGGQLNPHEVAVVDMGLTSAAHPNAIGVLRGNLAEPGLFSSRQLAAAQRAFTAAPPQLEIPSIPGANYGAPPSFGTHGGLAGGFPAGIGPNVDAGRGVVGGMGFGGASNRGGRGPGYGDRGFDADRSGGYANSGTGGFY